MPCVYAMISEDVNKKACFSSDCNMFIFLIQKSLKSKVDFCKPQMTAELDIVVFDEIAAVPRKLSFRVERVPAVKTHLPLVIFRNLKYQPYRAILDFKRLCSCKCLFLKTKRYPVV